MTRPIERSPRNQQPATESSALRQEGAFVANYELPLAVEPTSYFGPETPALDLRISWGETVLHAVELSPPRSFCVGEQASKRHKLDFQVPKEKLGTPLLPLVLSDVAGIGIVIPGHAQGWLRLPDRSLLSLDAVREVAQPYPELAHACRFPLPAGARIRIELSDLVFEIQSSVAARRMPHAPFDSERAAYFALSFISTASLLAASAALVPPLGLINGETVDRDDALRMLQYLTAAAERERESEVAEAAQAEAQSGGTGSRAQADEGAMGKASANPSKLRFAVKGPPDNPEPHLARQAALRDAAAFGMIGLLSTGQTGDPNAPSAPWGREASLGQDAESALGAMWGDAIGPNAGVGGLGLTNVGDGGGGIRDAVGLGVIGTVGHSSGTGIDDGFGSHHGRVPGTHKSQGPKMRMGVAAVSGRLPKEAVQRIVRLNFGRFRLCYEHALARNPNLEGRVNVQFVIDRAGAVSSASNGGSSLSDADAVNCVVRAFYGLSFPKPDNGLVTVSYPLMFAPE